jgi:hypothetical protein
MPLSAVLKGYQAEKIRMSNNATADERARQRVEEVTR